IKQLILLLKLLPESEKSLVFSQYTGFLDLIELQLKRERIPYVRLDGSLSEQRRTQVVREFWVPLTGVNGGGFEDETCNITIRDSRAKGKQKATAPTRRNPVVMLISLKAGALGLNLTVASRVFLMDPWWQSAIEEQAIDRVNRIGQTKEVHVYRLVSQDTVETSVLAIQARKQTFINEFNVGLDRAIWRFQKFHGRTFNMKNENYTLPSDEEEYERLDIQHLMLKMAIDSLYAAHDLVRARLAMRDDRPAPQVLDIGCGSELTSGLFRRAIQMAEEFEHAEILGIDLALPILNSDALPVNCRFEVDDINLSLSHYSGCFDIVHVRMVDSGIDNYPKFLDEVARIL
ncbi:hypothetical protein FRB99_002821, partial [Tulasnella sp. 403]